MANTSLYKIYNIKKKKKNLKHRHIFHADEQKGDYAFNNEISFIAFNAMCNDGKLLFFSSV